MQGFTDRALICFSDVDKYNSATSMWRSWYQKSLDNLCARLALDNITPCVMYTDPLALVLKHSCEVLATSDRADMFFMATHGMPKLATTPLDKRIVDLLNKKFPTERGITADARGYLIGKRTALAERELLKEFKLVIAFGTLYKPKTKDGDERAIITVSQQFIPHLKLSGFDAQIGAFMQYPGATAPMYDWSVN